MSKYFVSQTGLIDFVVIEEEFDQLHEYLSEVLIFTEQKLKDINITSLRPETLPAEQLDWEWIEKDRWEDNFTFFCPSMTLVSLYLFVEKSLKNLCYSFSEVSNDWKIRKNVRFKVPKKNTESIIEASLSYLLKTKKFKFKVSPEMISILDKTRTLRNNFAHGDWENVREMIDEVEVNYCFRIVGNLFEQIEAGLVE